MNKRGEIAHIINKVKEGVLFDSDTLISEEMKRSDITAVFCELKKAGAIRSLMRGVFYKPEISSYGFGELPVDKEELIRYFTKKHNAHISGQYGYLLGLTEQNAQTVTLAGEKPFKEFCVQKCFFDYMKSGVGYLTNPTDVPLAILLDALTNIDSKCRNHS